MLFLIIVIFSVVIFYVILLLILSHGLNKKELKFYSEIEADDSTKNKRITANENIMDFDSFL